MILNSKSFYAHLTWELDTYIKRKVINYIKAVTLNRLSLTLMYTQWISITLHTTQEFNNNQQLPVSFISQKMLYDDLAI